MHYEMGNAKIVTTTKCKCKTEFTIFTGNENSWMSNMKRSNKKSKKNTDRQQKQTSQVRTTE